MYKQDERLIDKRIVADKRLSYEFFTNEEILTLGYEVINSIDRANNLVELDQVLTSIGM